MTYFNNLLSRLTYSNNTYVNLFFLFVVTFITSTFFAVLIHFINMNKAHLSFINL